jgi:hypothetical protein
MNIDRAFLAHCISAVEAGNDTRSPSGLTLIDGAILGALHVNAEHAYRVAHHKDVAVMRQWGIDRCESWDSRRPFTPCDSAAADLEVLL